MRILVVEDEVSIQQALAKGLRQAGYLVDIACDGEAALDCFFANQYLVVVLDLNLPKLSGFEVLAAMRQESPTVNILILSAQADAESKIQGLDNGANDYLDKPFHFGELLARVRALTRRDFVQQTKQIAHNTLMIDTAQATVFIGGKEIVLPQKQYRMLEYLLLKKGRIVPPSELIQYVWGEDDDELQNRFKVHMNGLRKNIPDNIIKNKRGCGYYVD